MLLITNTVNIFLRLFYYFVLHDTKLIIYLCNAILN